MPEIPAEAIFGEAGICSVQAMIAAAWVLSRNPVAFGWHGQPSATAEWVSKAWRHLPDYSNGGRYLLSLEDLKRAEVKQMIEGLAERARFECARGLGLVIY